MMKIAKVEMKATILAKMTMARVTKVIVKEEPSVKKSKQDEKKCGTRIEIEYEEEEEEPMQQSVVAGNAW